LERAFSRIRGDLPNLKSVGRVDSFVKLESYDQYKEARWINSRCDQFKAWSGRFFHAIEAETYRHAAFIKHVPIPERPALINGLRKTGYFYYENDFKAFESHFVPKFMQKCECMLYEYLLAQWPREAKFITRVLTGTNRLSTRAGVKINIRGRRMSGDMCTSVGNGFSNLMLFLYILDQKGADGDGFVEGDDGIFRSSVRLCAADYTNLGFTVEIKEIAEPCLGHFCGMTFLESGQIVKDPRRVLQTFGWTSSCVHAGDAVMLQLLRAKALSLCYEVPCCPIVGVLARKALEFTEGVMPRFEQSYRAVPVTFRVPEFAPLESTRALFARLFHVSIEAQLIVEQMIRTGDLSGIRSVVIPHEDVGHYEAHYLERR